MLIWLNCSSVRHSRNALLTRRSMVARIDFLRSTAISVNMIPTTELCLYQPVTSVSRVVSERAERTFSSAFPFLALDKNLPASSSMSRNGFPERSARLRSKQTILWKCSSDRMLGASARTRSAAGASVSSCLPISEYLPSSETFTSVLLFLAARGWGGG